MYLEMQCDNIDEMRELMKKLLRVFTKPNDELYVYWQYEGEDVQGAYNLMYSSSKGIKPLKEILEYELNKQKENIK